jgi:hypothetical protein
MVARMPVAGGDDDVEVARPGELVDPPRDLVAVRDGQRPARREVVLKVDYDESARNVAAMSSSP